MNMQLIKNTDPLLRKPAKELSLDQIPAMREQFSQMHDVMHARGGIGLAAPQVGLDANVFVMEWMGVQRTCINPIILEASEERYEAEEGCLSFPGLRLTIERPNWILAGWYDEDAQPKTAKLVGMEARVFLHEWDHCQGILFTDRVGKVTLMLAKKRAEKEARRKK